jgi:hypothetical protein
MIAPALTLVGAILILLVVPAEPVKGSALDIPAEPLTGCQCLLARSALRLSLRASPAWSRDARLVRYAIQQREQNPRWKPHNGLNGLAPFVRQGAPPAANSACRVSGPLVRVPGLSEGSGVAASRRTPGVLWAHNDSGDPVIIALNAEGSVIGRVRVAGADREDWEDIAVGACPAKSCVYIADIGDNNGSREYITVYRTAEPASGDRMTEPVEIFEAMYPDGAHDAEALFVTPDGDLFIITKGDPGPVALYKFPPPLRPGVRVRLERVGDAVATSRIDAKDRPTAADMSHDGKWVAVRTTHWVAFYRAADLTAGRWREAFRTDVSRLREPRGEGITFAGNGSVVLVGEGGFASSRGSFARLACTLPE